MPKQFWTTVITLPLLMATAAAAASTNPDYVGADASIFIQDATVRKVFHDQKGFEKELKANQILLEEGVPTGALGADRAARAITYKRQKAGALYDIMEAGVGVEEADAYYEKMEELGEYREELKKKGIVHGDPHLKNILVDDEGNLFLHDWGRMARKFDGKRRVGETDAEFAARKRKEEKEWEEAVKNDDMQWKRAEMYMSYY